MWLWTGLAAGSSEYDNETYFRLRSGAVETFGSSGEHVTSLKSEVLRSLKIPASYNAEYFFTS